MKIPKCLKIAIMPYKIMPEERGKQNALHLKKERWTKGWSKKNRVKKSGKILKRRFFFFELNLNRLEFTRQRRLGG